MTKFILLFFAVSLCSTAAHAGTYFVRTTVLEKGVSSDEGYVARELIEDAVADRPGDSLVDEEEQAGYILEPHLLRVDKTLLLTVEKRQRNSDSIETLFVSQKKASDLKTLKEAARIATNEAIEEPSLEGQAQETSAAERKKLNRQLANNDSEPAIPYRGDSTSGATTPPEKSGVDVLPPARPNGSWNLGAGLSYANRIGDGALFYGINGGYSWLLQPHVEVDVFADGAFSSGNSDAHWFRLGAGANYLFRRATKNNAPYVSVDAVYGFVSDATGDNQNGFGLSTGAGFRFFKANESSLDLSVKYAIVFANLRAGQSPESLGVNLSVNF